MGKVIIVAIAQEITGFKDSKYKITLYSNSGSSVIHGVANNISEFGLVENDYQFQFHGGVVGFSYFEIWFKYEKEVAKDYAENILS